MSHLWPVSGGMMDSPPDVFQHTLMLFKDAGPPRLVYGGAAAAQMQKKNEILLLWAHKCMDVHQTRFQVCTLRQTHVSRNCAPLFKGDYLVIHQHFSSRAT